MSGLVLSWRPFLDPIDAFHVYWWALLVPLSLGVAVVYKAVRLRSLDHYVRHVFVLTTQIVAAMIALGIAVHLFVEVYVRFISGAGH